MPPRRSADSSRAFTLLEIVLVMAIILLIVSIGLPSMRGQLSRKKLQDAFERFDTLVIEAQRRSAADHEPYVLAWQRDGSVRLFPVVWTPEQRAKRQAAAAWQPEGSDERYVLVRGGSLDPKSIAEWTFWPSGNCEPVAVKYQGSAGTWEADYNPLSGRGNFRTFFAR